MPKQTTSKRIADQKEVTDIQDLVSTLAHLVERGRVSIRLGPISDVREWLNNYEAFEKTKIAVADAASVRVTKNGLEIDLGLDGYSS